MHIDKAEFREKGIVAVRSGLSQGLCRTIRESVLAELDRLKLRINGKFASSRLEHLPVFQQSGALGQKVRTGPELDVLFPNELVSALASLAGRPLKPSQPRPQLLLSFPHKQAWSLDNLNWHLDLALPKRDQIPGVQAFALLDDLAPRGGATLALAGSHRLPYASADSATAVSLLREHPVLQGLFGGAPHPPEQLLRPYPVEGVEVQVVEMTGRAGDLFLMDLRILHSPSVNAQKRMRMMATNRFIAAP